jgi:multifunctional beta-oxidation protein
VCLDNEETSGALFEVLGGWAAQTRWQRSGGYSFPSKVPYTPEDVVAKWKSITSFGELYYTLFFDLHSE